MIASGVAAVPWTVVPPGIFDAGEDTLEWVVRASGDTVNVGVSAAIAGPGEPTGIAVELRCGSWRAAAEFDAAGRATLPLVDTREGGPVTSGSAWNADWSAAELVIGAGQGEPVEVRDQVRSVARARLAVPPPDAFLAEVLAAEADY